MATVVEHRKFSLTNLGNNNNKWWNVTLFDNGDVMSEYGRQGDAGLKKVWPGAGRRHMESKIREKEAKGYRENHVVETTEPVKTARVDSSKLKDIAAQQIKTQSKLVRDLIDYLVQVNAHQIAGLTGGKISYDTSTAQFKTTQGVVVPAQVALARTLLSDIADMIASNDWSNYDFEHKANEYLSIIPRDFGRKRLSVRDIFPNLQKIQQENSLLDGLDASFAGLQKKPTVTTVKSKKDTVPSIFNVEMEEVTDSKTISMIRNLYQDTRKSMHQSNSLSITKIYKVFIQSERDSYDRDGAKLNNTMHLWHGTKASNLLSIMRQGLVIPPSSSSHVTGRMFGNGIYGSDISTKALNYATNYWNGGGTVDRTFMFLCDFAMGKMYISRSYCDWKGPQHGYDSTFAKGGSGSGVHNNEMIVYRTSQVRLCYLVEFSPRAGY